MRSRCGRRAFRASPIRCVGERIMATGVPEFREVAWRACSFFANASIFASNGDCVERSVTRCSSF
ncbi:hypothetical protein [Bathymodiolus japonicus methanotrophic gill symbiont]|uniref:hypothetical protein n=1 Tax=Bathymodiolus japonicus methanotrophic gill symbiont TaxID=113269 RepID=UPI001C8D0C59|nr:hypothetical protein [Bathymodiolus japonicus methanotrophic gill symbiont]